MCNRVLLLFGKLPQQNLLVICHVNGTTFQSDLRFQTGSSKRALIMIKGCLYLLKMVSL